MNPLPHMSMHTTKGAPDILRAAPYFNMDFSICKYPYALLSNCELYSSA